tara:strand:+ start:246 stop:716 length:471 start_codon:yes stop_codon:yes gene_type:complete
VKDTGIGARRCISLCDLEGATLTARVPPRLSVFVDRTEKEAGDEEVTGLGFFQGALQRVLILTSEVHHLVHLGFGKLVWENSAHADALLMDVEHHPRGLFHIHSEKPFEHDDNELHWSVIVIQQQDFVLAWLLWFRTRFCRDVGLTVTFTGVVVSG